MWAAPGNGLDMRVLWTDTPYAPQRVEGLHAACAITDRERDDLLHFIDHGWLVWRGAIPPSRIDRFAADIRSHHEHPGKFVTTDHRAGNSKLKRSGDVPEQRMPLASYCSTKRELNS